MITNLFLVYNYKTLFTVPTVKQLLGPECVKNQWYVVIVS